MGAMKDRIIEAMDAGIEVELLQAVLEKIERHLDEFSPL